MRKFIIVLILFTTLAQAHAQKSKIVGSWLMTKVEINGEVKHPYQIFEFKKDGKLLAMGMELATWTFDKSKNTITMSSKMDKDFNGVNSIIKLDKKKLVVQKDGAKYFYSRLNPKKIAKNNKKSKLAGNWEIAGEEFSSSLLQFKLPDSFTLIQSAGGVTDKFSGTWIYQPKTKSVLMIGFFQENALRGENKIQKLSKNKLILKNGANTTKAKRIKKKNQAIERLTFKEEELPEEQPAEGPQLPWTDFYAMVDFLQNIQQLDYTYGQLVPETKSLKHPFDIISKLTVDPDKPSVRFTNFSVTADGENQFSEKYRSELSGSSNLFFPQKELWPYRIMGTEPVTVPAGTFMCTVVEGFDTDTRVKYWLINDMPGIFAKVIKDGEGPFGDPEYSVMELKTIKQNPQK